MSVVVTGAAGFIGGHLCTALTAAGHAVIAIDRRPMPLLPIGAAELRADLLTAEAADAIRGASAVFHLAARSGVREQGPGLAAARHRDNVLATAAVLDAAPRGVPVVVTSSSSVYGGSPLRRGRGCREDDPLRPRGGYAESKVAVEQLCAARREAGGAVAVVRPFTVVGERQRPDMAVALWLDAVASGRPVRVLGDLRRSRDLTDVHDVVRCLVELADLGLGRTVNVGTGVGHTLAEVLDVICAAVGRQALVEVVPAVAEDVPATLADTGVCEQLIGWCPRTDLSAVVARQLAAARSGTATASTATAPSGTALARLS